MRTIIVKTHPLAHTTKVVSISPSVFEVWVNAAPSRGKANKAVMRALAHFLDVPVNTLLLLRGETTRQKLIGIL